MTPEFACIQCKSLAASPFFSDCEDYYLHKPYRANYVCCEGCGLIQQAPIPTEVTSFYDDYPIHQKKSQLHRLTRQWVMGSCYFHTHEFLEGTSGQTVLLDFGCGDGWFLEASRDPNLNLVGFEARSNYAGDLAKRLNAPVYSDEHALLRDYTGKCDVVTMHFVLEHLMDLNKAFETVSRLLKRDGVFYFIVPNISSWEARLFGKKWHNLDAPRHISFPEGRSIRQLSNRWGFEVSKHREVPFPNGIAGSLSVLFTGRFRFSIFVLFLPLGILLSRIFPSGTAAYWLKKNRSSDVGG